MFHQSKRVDANAPFSFSSFFRVYRYGLQAIGLVWQTSRKLTLTLACLTLIAGILPALTAYVGKLIVDAVVLASQSGVQADIQKALWFVALEAGIITVQAGAQRGLSVCQSLLRALLSQRVNVLILEKTIHLELRHFEDANFYDRLTQARREASVRPLSLVNRSFALLQNLLSLLSYGGLLLAFSPWAVLVLALAGIPAFVVETRYSGEAFRLFKWRSPETRKRAYLEMVLAREDFAKEVQLFELGPGLLQRYRAIFQDLYHEDRNLTLRRGFWGYLLGLLSSAAFYGAYGWIVWETVHGSITLGDMTMYLMLFRQGQAAFSASLTAIGGMHEDNLYLSNLYSFLEESESIPTSGVETGVCPGDGLRFENVWFTYPEAEQAALRGINFHLQPGEKLALVGENGSGKTTLIKLLTRLYVPSSGRILLDGTDLAEWSLSTLRRRTGVIFQDFVRYQFSVGENIGAGDVSAFEDSERWREAARKGLALPFVDRLPEGFSTQLGKWFHQGQELSGGQWQKIALSRAFMRRGADILVLDEPTSAIDAEAEMRIFEQFRQEAVHQMAILISHRFSTVRIADHIIVLEQGEILEQGSHESLLEAEGRYAQLFHMQAAGYR